MKIRRRKTSKKVVLAVLTACVVVGSVAYIVYAQQTKQPAKPNKPITYSGPSEQDKKDAEDNKKEVAAQQAIENQSSNTSQKKQVNPVITNARQSAQQITINAYISGVFEDGGTCTAVATKGSASVTRSSKAFADATTTSCAPIFVDRSAFPESGSWNVVVSYSSNTAEGKSQATPLAIQ